MLEPGAGRREERPRGPFSPFGPLGPLGPFGSLGLFRPRPDIRATATARKVAESTAWTCRASLAQATAGA